MRRDVVRVAVAILAGGAMEARGFVIDFEGHPSGTQITNQYLAYGVLFSGAPGDPPPETYDYGPASYGSILHSHDWYSATRVDFVDPSNPGVYRPVSRIEFDNPVSPEVDYVVVEVFNAGGQLVYTYTSVSPERVIIDLGADLAAFMILDDDAATAYIIDNLEATSVLDLFADGFESGDTGAWSFTSP